ncbi:tetratricopeptide repeat protein, partial [Dehalococcoidia bacterium]|nr:tetratricopeptide repeat protein [Dehalococcoidia bacterium]
GQRGFAYRQLREYSKAVDDLSEAIRLNPEDSWTYGERAVSYNELEEHSKAIDDATEAIRLDPERDFGYGQRGFAYRRFGEHSKAVDDYSETIRLNPEIPFLYGHRAVSYNELEEHSKAIDDATEAIRLDPESDFGYGQRGFAYRRLGEHSKAVDDLSEAIRLNPEDSWTYGERAVSYNGLEEHSKAVDDLSEAIRLNPEEPWTYGQRAVSYNELNEHSKAIDDATEAIRLDPESVLGYGQRGFAYSQFGDLQEAINDLSEAIRLNPEDPWHYKARGFAFSQIQEYQEAIDDFSEAISLNPEDPWIYGQRGFAYSQLREFQKAIDDLSESIKLESDLTEGAMEAYIDRADSYMALKEYQAAIDDYSTSIDFNPSNPDALRKRSIAYTQLSFTDKAIEDLKEVLLLEPNTSDSGVKSMDDAGRPVIPERVGPYEISDLIFGSDLSWVYRGYDSRMARTVAIKIPPPWALGNAELFSIYETEAKLIARIEHPNIVKAYDFEARPGADRPTDDTNVSVWDPPSLYTVMEFIPRSLADLIKQNITISINESIRVAVEVCKGVAYLHSLGLVHGDLKPGHILVGDNSEVKISNFLSVKRTGLSKLDLTGLNIQSGINYETSGTPSNMSPELWENEPLSPRSDIYSLGIMLYEMLTGGLPFQGQPMELFYKHQNQPIPTFSTDLNVPQALEDVVKRSTEKLPELRFASATEMQFALETVRV